MKNPTIRLGVACGYTVTRPRQDLSFKAREIVTECPVWVVLDTVSIGTVLDQVSLHVWPWTPDATSDTLGDDGTGSVSMDSGEEARARYCARAR